MTRLQTDTNTGGTHEPGCRIAVHLAGGRGHVREHDHHGFMAVSTVSLMSLNCQTIGSTWGSGDSGWQGELCGRDLERQGFERGGALELRACHESLGEVPDDAAGE